MPSWKGWMDIVTKNLPTTSLIISVPYRKTLFLKKNRSNSFVCLISVNLTCRSQKRTEQTTFGSTLDVHDLYKRPGIFIASDSPNHYNVNHRHNKLNATKPYLLWYIIRVFRPTHRVCNDTMENVMFQGDSTNSLSSVVINSCGFYSIQKHIQHFKLHEEPDTTVPTGQRTSLPSLALQNRKSIVTRKYCEGRYTNRLNSRGTV